VIQFGGFGGLRSLFGSSRLLRPQAGFFGRSSIMGDEFDDALALLTGAEEVTTPRPKRVKQEDATPLICSLLQVVELGNAL
jgi:hypothetical protein